MGMSFGHTAGAIADSGDELRQQGRRIWTLVTRRLGHLTDGRASGLRLASNADKARQTCEWASAFSPKPTAHGSD